MVQLMASRERRQQIKKIQRVKQGRLEVAEKRRAARAVRIPQRQIPQLQFMESKITPVNKEIGQIHPRVRQHLAGPGQERLRKDSQGQRRQHAQAKPVGKFRQCLRGARQVGAGSGLRSCRSPRLARQRQNESKNSFGQFPPGVRQNSSNSAKGPVRLPKRNELRFLLRESWTQNSGGTESSRNKSRVELNPGWDARLQFGMESEWLQRLGPPVGIGENCYVGGSGEATGVVVAA